jgi:hypothetical protein
VTAVTIRPTVSKDTRPSNGLEEIADKLLEDQFGTHYVVGIVQFAGGSVPGPGEHIVPAVKFLGIEPLTGTAAEDAAKLLDQARKGRGLGRMEDAIVRPEPALFDLSTDEDGKVEVRMTGDGEHQVPGASGEELTAELDERRAAEAEEAGTFVADETGATA